MKGLLEIEITKHLAGWQIRKGRSVGGIASRRTRMGTGSRGQVHIAVVRKPEIVSTATRSTNRRTGPG